MNATAASPRPDRVENGTGIGPYEVVGPLGAGGMGLVVQALDPRLGRSVAIKVLYRDAAADERRLNQFMAEARAASALNHPNILTVYEIGTSERGPYLVTELVEGETLRTVLHRGAVPLPLALELVQQTLAGLSRAHAAGIVHRDIKPENLMVRADGLVKILDFGLAKLAGSTPGAPPAWAIRVVGPSATETGMVQGTPAYMSPEQVRGARVGPASDVFSLCLVLYELAGGVHPFRRSGPDETMKAIARDEPELLPGLPAALQDILRKGLAKRVSARYAHAGEMHADVLELRRSLAPATDPVAVPVITPGPANSSPRRRRALRAGAAAGVALALCGWRMAVHHRGTPVRSPEVRALYARGRFSSSRSTEESLRTASEYFTRSIDRDPKDAASYAGLADSELALASFGGVPPAEAAPRAEAAALKALSLDPRLPDAHVSLGSVRFWYDWKWREAEIEFRKAISLDPSHAEAHHRLGMLLLALGRFEESRAALSRAADLDPVSLPIAADRGLPDLFEGRYEAAVGQFRGALALDGAFVPARVDLATALALDGRPREAEAEFRRANELDRSEPEGVLVRAFGTSVRGDRGRALAALSELESASLRHAAYPFRVALLYAFLGEREAAFRWLERGYRHRCPDMVYLKTHPLARNLRADPRFDRLVERIGLNEPGR